MSPHRYYRHSGRFSVPGLGIALAIVVVTVFLLSWVYGYAEAWIPLIYLNVVLAFLYGLMVGGAVVLAVKKGKIRNRVIIVALGVLAAVLAEWWGWMAWIFAASSQEALVLNPIDILTLVIPKLAETGVWSIHGATPTGWILYLCWLGEVLFVVGMIYVTVSGGTGGEAYCEDCQAWVEDSQIFQPYGPVQTLAELRSELENHNYERITRLAPQQASPFYKLSLRRCNCQKLHLFSLSEVTVTVNQKGETNTNDKPVLNNLLLTQANYAALAHSLKQAGLPPESTET